MGYKYSTEGVPVEEVVCAKDLGVTFTTTAHCKMYTLKPTVCWVYLAGQ